MLELNENEIEIIELLRRAEPFSQISITKKADKDSVEFRVEIRTLALLKRKNSCKKSLSLL